MANDITAVSVLSEAGSTTKQVRTYTTEAILNPLLDHLYIAVIQAGSHPPRLKLTGTSLNWVQIGSTLDTITKTTRLAVYRAMKSSGTPVADHLVVDTGGHVVDDLSISVIDFNFVDTSGTDGSGAIVQSVLDGTTSSNTGVQVGDVAALAAFGDPVLNVAFGAIVVEDGQAPQPPDTYNDVDTIVSAAGLLATFKTGSDTRVLATWDDAASYIYFAAEIKAANAKKRIVLSVPETLDFAFPLKHRFVSGGDTSLVATSLAGLTKRVGEKLSLAYDRPGFERNLLHDLANEAVLEVLLETHCYIQIGDTVTLTPGVAEYRIPSEVLAIDDGRGSTPAGIGQYEIITLSEMIERQSANIVSPTFRKMVAIEGNLLIVSPTPETNEVLRFFYVPKPANPMTADNDDITNPVYGGLPVWGRRAVETYMLWQGAEYDDKVSPLSPKDYKQLFEDECATIKHRTRRMRGRTSPRARIGYPGSRRPQGGFRNDRYPRDW